MTTADTTMATGMARDDHYNFGYLDEPDIMRSIQLFAAEVMPALRDYEPY